VWRTIARRKLVILAVTALVFGIVCQYAFLETPIYEGIARVQIDPTRSSNLGLYDGDKSNDSNTDSRIRTEVSIIQSNTVAMRVMNALKLYANPHFAGDEVAEGNVSDISQLRPSQQRRLVDRFSGGLTVKVIPDTEVVEIHFRSSDPTIASDVANSVIDEYMNRNFHVRVDGTTQASQWLSRELDEIRASTAASQERLANFQRRTNFLGSGESDNIVTDRLKQLNEELTQAEAERIVKEGRYRLAESGNPELIASVAPGTTLQVLRTQEADLNEDYAQLSAKYGDGYPKLREVASELTRLHAAIDAEGSNTKTRMWNDLSAAEKAEAMIRSEFDQQKQAAYKLNDNAAQYANLKHEVESGQQLYDTLQLKLKEAGITSGLTSSYIDVVDRAQLPDKPVEPRKALDLAMGLGAGLFCGLIVGFVFDSFDDAIETSEQLETITALPELASVPFVRSLAASNKRRVSSDNLELTVSQFNPICVREPNAAGSESYRSLCSVILISSLKTSLGTIVVTSAMPDEGKSTVCINLATALAQRGRRVLLVDADLRCSSIRRRFGSGPGLSTILTEPNEYPVYRPLSQIPNLCVIPAGGQLGDPMEVLDSPRMKKLMAGWKAEFDYVIIDTPPLLPFSDALTLSAVADGVILVTRSGMARAKPLLRARDVLLRSGAKIIGFVLNAIKRPEYFYAYPLKYEQRVNRKYGNVS
jgi:capsular exopolysaccharide synthesis family protein